MGVTSFVLSLVGLFLFPIPLGILAVIFGVNNKDENQGLATAGIVIGIIDIVVGFLILSMLT